MPFYQLMCITAHYREYRHIKDLVKLSAMSILNEGGVVRNIDYWGLLNLPQKMRRHDRHWHHVGDYWTMHFDTSPRALRELNGILRRDPRVLRWTMLKLGEKVEDVVLPKEKTVRRSWLENTEPKKEENTWQNQDPERHL